MRRLAADRTQLLGKLARGLLGTWQVLEQDGDIVARGFDEKTVRWVQRRVDLNEYKREQAAPGLKVTSRAFRMGRKMPIAQRYVD